MLIRRFTSAAMILLAAAAFGAAAEPPRDLAKQRTDLLSPSAGRWGIDFNDQDRSIRPGDNFYEYQNGAWLKSVQFGPNEKAQAYWRDLRLLASRRVQALLEGFAADHSAPPASAPAKAGAFYRSFMDTATIEAKALSPLKPELDALRVVTTKSELARIMGGVAGPGTLRAPSVYVPIGWSFFRLDDINQDRAHPGRYAVYMAAGGMALPGPEYYSEAQFANLRSAYVSYIAKVLALLGWSEPDLRAHQILELETKVAAVSWSHAQLRGAADTYNPMTVADLAAFAPGFDWRAFLAGAGLSHVPSVVIDAKSAFPRIAAVYDQAPLEVLKARQAFGLADQRVDFLNAALLSLAIDFRGNALGDGVFFGAAPRALRAEKASEAAMGDILSAAYVAKYSSPEVKAQALAMAENMRRALDSRLATISWMSPAGRAAARAKLMKMHILIGYPDRFDDFAGLEIDDHDLYGNYLRAGAYQWRALVAMLDRHYNGARWSVRAEYPTFNYSFASNTVEIPAALLVPPFFDVNADPAVNYGAAGTIIGAMIASPFFTKQGLSYDQGGRLHPLLGADEMARFSQLWGRLAAQYSRVEQLPGFPLKGELLADEALGDLAGLEISLAAYRNHAGAAPTLDGYTGDQRFFLGRAQMWRAKFVESFIRSQIATGSNEPPFMRVNGLLPNMAAWNAAFHVQPTDKLYIAPSERVTLW